MDPILNLQDRSTRKLLIECYEIKKYIAALQQ